MDDASPPPEHMPPESAWTFMVSYIPDQEFGQKLGAEVAGIIRDALLAGFNLSRLEGVTISASYADSLAELDRGTDQLGSLKPSEEFGVGMAMAAPVLRDGQIMDRLMLDAGIVNTLLSDDEAQQRFGLCTIVHELAHVHDLAMKEAAFPDTFLKPYQGNALDAALFNLSSIAWDEFIATEMSAALQPESLDQFDEIFESSLDELLVRLAAARRSYGEHGDHLRATQEMKGLMFELFKLSAYVIGTLEGLDKGDEYGPRSRDKLFASRFAPTFDELRQALRKMQKTYPDWESIEVYAPLRAIAQKALEREGLFYKLWPDGRLSVQIREPAA